MQRSIYYHQKNNKHDQKVNVVGREDIMAVKKGDRLKCVKIQDAVPKYFRVLKKLSKRYSTCTILHKFVLYL